MRKDLKQLYLEIENTEAKLLELKNKALALDSSTIDDGLKPRSELRLEDYHVIKDELEEKDKLIQLTDEFFKVGRWSYQIEGELIKWSLGTYNIFEYPEDYKGSIIDYYISCIDEKTTARLPEMKLLFGGSKENSVMNQTIIMPNGNKKWLSFFSVPLLDKAGKVVGSEGLIKDVSNSVTGKNGMDNFFNLSNELHCILHIDKYFVKVSPAWTKLLGYTEKELLSQSFLHFIHPDDKLKSSMSAVTMENWNDEEIFENRYIKKSGEVVYLSWSFRLDKETFLAYCTARDITKSKLEKEELLIDLSSKELMLREVHHRVKNNLQIVSSLLSLQSGANREEEHLVKLYQDSQNRIKSMAAIHEMFYQSEKLDKIEFGKYMDKLIGDLSLTFSSENISIDFSMNVTPVQVSLDTAIPLGLLINEVVTNSIKYGGDDQGMVNIFIEIEILSEGKFQFIIGDKGVNSQQDILNRSSESLGILLINSLVEQLDGEIEQLKDTVGTVYKLVFTNKLEREL